ncbi:MAG: NAD-binding protein [Anaerolineae bacterium]|nr:NAD-binding protein [Anaerolineae bacterium]
MFVIIVGGGKTGSRLARILLSRNYQVRVIEHRREVLERLRKELPEETIVAGDGSSPGVLERAGIVQADALAAVTGEDETNLVVTTLARFEFDVPFTVARVNNPLNAWLFTKEMGVDVAFDQAELIARMIEEELLLGDIAAVLRLHGKEVSLVRKIVRPNSPAAGKVLHELALPRDCVLAAVIRGDEIIVPHGGTRLEVNDHILAVVHNACLSLLSALFDR